MNLFIIYRVAIDYLDEHANVRSLVTVFDLYAYIISRNLFKRKLASKTRYLVILGIFASKFNPNKHSVHFMKYASRALYPYSMPNTKVILVGIFYFYSELYNKQNNEKDPEHTM